VNYFFKRNLWCHTANLREQNAIDNKHSQYQTITLHIFHLQIRLWHKFQLTTTFYFNKKNIYKQEIKCIFIDICGFLNPYLLGFSLIHRLSTNLLLNNTNTNKKHCKLIFESSMKENLAANSFKLFDQ